MYKSILLPVDMGHESSWQKAAPAAVSMAQQHGAKIHMLTVIPDYGMAVVGSFFPKDHAEAAKAATDVELKKLADQLIPPELLAGTETVHGTIYKEIIAAASAHGCDVIVMSSHRPEMADYLLGPNSARVVRHADQSVFVVRS